MSDTPVVQPANKNQGTSSTVIERLGRYDLIHRIGAGGMAECFLARQRGPMGFEKLVVVKKIHEHLTRQPAFIEMLLKEARISALLKHPKIVDIYDLGHVDGTYFIAMEYLAGQPLTKIIPAAVRAKKPLGVEMAAKIISEAADALAAAHDLKTISGEQLGLIHRDVSPGNIMVMYDGTVKLLDFGIAKARGEATLAGGGPLMLKGKTGYVAPEQIETGEVDKRTDVFSLGVVMWEILAHRRLFRSDDDAATLEMIKTRTPESLTTIRTDMPKALDAICMKALARDPDKRYQTAHEIRIELENFLWTQNYHRAQHEMEALMTVLFSEVRAAQEEIVRRAVAPATPIVEADDDDEMVVIEEEEEEDDDLAIPAEGARRLPLPAPGQTGQVPTISPPKGALGKRTQLGFAQPVTLTGEDQEAPHTDLRAMLEPSNQDEEITNVQDPERVTDVKDPPSVPAEDKKKLPAIPTLAKPAAPKKPRRPTPAPVPPASLRKKPPAPPPATRRTRTPAPVPPAKPRAKTPPVPDAVTKRPKTPAPVPDAVTKRPKTPAPVPVEKPSSAPTKQPARAQSPVPEVSKPTPAPAPDVPAPPTQMAAALSATGSNRKRWIAISIASALLLTVVVAVAASGGGGSDDTEDTPKDNPLLQPTKRQKLATAPIAEATPDAAPVEEPVEEPVVDKPRVPGPVVPPVTNKRVVTKPPTPTVTREERHKRATKHYNDGVRYYIKKEWTSARRSFRDATKADKGYAPAYRGLGLAYERSGKKKSALKALKKYVRMAPNARDAESIKKRIARLGG